MRKVPNAQYNLAEPRSLSVRVATRMRHRMFGMFMAEFEPSEADQILDIGVTSDQTYSSSNYFEALYPYKHRITAAGLDDASFLEDLYPGLRFQFADACRLPFDNNVFDYVHSSAVLEHVGGYRNQQQMLLECLRVARKGICLTTPNPWFPIEFHTQMPLLHWLPKSSFRSILLLCGQRELASEANLNLITEREIRCMSTNQPGWSFRFASTRLLGFKSNLVVFARNLAHGGRN
jgi:ubiquinone/menaquinone biosynthesis C-methylase UbiE